MVRAVCLLIAGFVVWVSAAAQTLEPAKPGTSADALTNPAYSPGVSFLFDLEAKFAADAAKGGGAAFAKWFADDAVTLSNGQAPVIGKAAIAASTTWSPADYLLTWKPDGGRMSPAGDMGFTWGHYEGHFNKPDGSAGITSGRYMTVWKKQSDGSWKVALDASNNEPPKKEDCCKLP
ncbi:MAG: nuclear transport factor 2 family protein [Silvibacterium sp.]|nr:nuclear transport factor 2 family protein [Silvibacterium sp.]